MAAQSTPAFPFDDIATEYKRFEAQLGDEYIGTVVGGPDWCDFYVRHAGADVQILDQINASLDCLYAENPASIPSLKELGNLANGMPCAVRYEKDKKWYRALVVDTEYNMIRFVDYGNVQMCSESDIKAIPRFLVDVLPITTIPCKLTGAQDASLPSFVNDSSKVLITILTATEPYEVAVKILNDEAVDALNRQWPTTDYSGLSTMPQRRAPANPFNDTDDDLKKGARASTSGTSRSLPARVAPVAQSQNGQYNVQSGLGYFSEMYATCGTVRLVRFTGKQFEVNTEQTAYCGGPLQVSDLRRIFRVDENIRFNAKLEQPFLTPDLEYSRLVAEDGDDKKKKKGQVPERVREERWLVTDFRPAVENPNLLITHAVITFVGDNAASLHVRGSGDTIWAPKGTFPRDVATSPKSLKDIDEVQIGRSVLVRADPTDQLADFKMQAQWMAKAVEFVGVTYEERGWMYLVRENYSVIITEGNVGFGYVFVPNQYVEAEGTPMEEWYGSRVYFRSCVDVPDQSEDTRFGLRMKALRARLDPDEEKGHYRCAGIYRPQLVDDLDEGAAARASDKNKKWVNSEDEAMDLPNDAVEEMRLLGVDTIGIDKPPVFPPPEPVNMVRENVVNEMIDSGRIEPVQQTPAVSINTGGARFKVPMPAGGLGGARPKQPVSTEHGHTSVASTVPNVFDEWDNDMELRSTVEIFPVEPSAQWDWPITPRAADELLSYNLSTTADSSPAFTNLGDLARNDHRRAQISTDPKPRGMQLGDQAPPQPPISRQNTMVLTEMMGADVEKMAEERRVARAKAIEELRSMEPGDLDTFMEFTLHLKPDQRHRFKDLWKALMCVPN